MNTSSELYKSILSGNHSFEVKVNISATAEGLVQSSTDYGMDVLTSLSSRRSVFGSGSPRIGLAPSGELALSLYVESGVVPRMAELRPYIRVVNDTQQSEWIAKGVYYIDTREADTTTGLLTLHAYDSMLKGEQAYPSTSHSWPYSDINTVTEIASFLGVAVDAQTTSLMTAGFLIVYVLRIIPASYMAPVSVLAGLTALIMLYGIKGLVYPGGFDMPGMAADLAVGLLLAGFVLVFRFSLDYRRTESLRFEDDDYMYYVRAVPKMSRGRTRNKKEGGSRYE